MPGFARVAFGPFVLDGESRELLRGPEQVPVALGPKAMDLLLLLVAERRRVLPKHTLRERVWPDTHVSLETLYSLLKELRRALGDSGRHPQYVKNIKSVGYRFIAEVREVEQAQCPVRCWLVSRATRDEPLRDGEHILGRLQPSTLLLIAREVSRQHARIVVDGDRVRLADLHSKNKTFVNGQAIDPDAEPRLLVDGDEIRIGRFVFMFRTIEGTTATVVARQGAHPEQ